MCVCVCVCVPPHPTLPLPCFSRTWWGRAGCASTALCEDIHWMCGCYKARIGHAARAICMPACDDGLVTTRDLWKHAAAQHHSWSEYRKRHISEVQQCKTVPLQPIEKRRLAGNFYQDLLYSQPARNTLRPSECTMRQIVACATCAIKDWIGGFYPCFVWTEAPPDAAANATEHDNEDDQAEDENDAEEEHVSHKRAYGPQVRDEEGFCDFGPADKIPCPAQRGQLSARGPIGTSGRATCLERAAPEISTNAVAHGHSESLCAAAREYG